MKLKLVFPLIVFIVLILFFFRGLKMDPHRLPSALIDKSIPIFSLSELSVPKRQLNQTLFKGNVSLLNVWASWCSSCQLEHEVLQKIYSKYSDKIKFYGLNYKDQRQDAIEWLRKFGNPYQLILYDPDGSLGMDLGVYGTPETFIIDRKGVIRYKHVGPMTDQVWRDTLYPKIVELL